MARRAAQIEAIRNEKKNVIVLDCGDMCFSKISQTSLKPEVIFWSMKKMNYDVINVADGELSFSPDYFLKKAKMIGTRFVSANVWLKDDQTGLIKKYVVLNVGHMKICVTGILAPIYQPKDAEKMGISVTSPDEELHNVLNEVRGRVDLVILLAHLEYSATKDFLLLNDLKGIDIAIAGHGRNFTPDIEFINGTALVENSMGGEQFATLTVQMDQKNIKEKYKNENVELTEEYPDDPEIRKKLDELKKKEAEIFEKKFLGQKKKDEQKEQREILKLSPEEFIKTLKKDNVH